MQNTAIIPREVLFGNPDIAGVLISHDGKNISYLKEYEGYLNIYIAPIDNIKNEKRLTADKRGIRSYFWGYDNKHIIYAQDKNGDENWHIYKVNIENDKEINLTPFSGTTARIEKISKDKPNEIIIGLNRRDKTIFDLYKLNLDTADLELFFTNKEIFSSFMLDDNYNLRFAEIKDQQTGNEIYYFINPTKKEEFFTIESADVYTSMILGFNKNADAIYKIDSTGKDIGDLTLVELKSKQEKVIFKATNDEISNVLFNKENKTPIAVATNKTKNQWHSVDPSYQKDFEILLDKANGREIAFTSSTKMQDKWIIAFIASDSPIEYYLYDRNNQKLEFLFYNRKDLLNYKLAPMEPVIIQSRDKLDLVSYLTLPVDFTVGKSASISLILYVHGGPTVRDNWGYDPTTQWLANRGYAVLQVNYRGSTGFGKRFANAGRGEWGRKMHDDLIDAGNWAIKQGITSKDNIAIMGGSYGGYASLVGLTFTPDYFKCAIDIVGPSNLITLLESIPPYWKPAMKELELRTGGNIKTKKGKEFLKSRSPLTYVEKIKKPLLVFQGANDPRVKKAEADQIVEAMKRNNIPVTYILYPDEGHGFAKPENRKSYIALSELFLANRLGGKFEPIKDEIRNSSAKIIEGEKYLAEMN